jgi:hypothetical protein
MEKQKYVEEMLKEMREQFDFDKEEEKDLIKAIEQEYEECGAIK